MVRQILEILQIIQNTNTLIIDFYTIYMYLFRKPKK